MSKLSAEEKFFDLSDYGRPIAVFFVHRIKQSKITPIHLTLLFGLTGIAAVYCMFAGFYVTAGLLLVLKSIIDAADGELARVKNTPSYVGRYLDSVFDFCLNGLFFGAIAILSNSSFLLMCLAFFCFQVQGTLYNYYYVILRNRSIGGDTTSKIFEYKIPKAFSGESQQAVNLLFRMYNVCYRVFDLIVHHLDKEAYKVKRFPNWFMTFVSIYGLGFQLLIMSMMLALQWLHYIIPFFIAYSLFLVVLIVIRRRFIPVVEAQVFLQST